MSKIFALSVAKAGALRGTFGKYSAAFLVSFSAMFAPASIAPVQAADPLFRAPAPACTPGKAPCCTEPGVLKRVNDKFEIYDRNVLDGNYTMTTIRDVREYRYEARTADYDVERRYCSAIAEFADGSPRPMWFLIERPWGFASISWSVEFCVRGLDPWTVYGADCRVISLDIPGQ